MGCKEGEDTEMEARRMEEEKQITESVEYLRN
jgi:hypothetical protein